MPANLALEFKATEAAFDQAHDPRERLECLCEMLRTISKHKGTDHLQGNIKSRLKDLTENLASPKKDGTRGGPDRELSIACACPTDSGGAELILSVSG